MEHISQQILIVDTDFVKRIESKMDSILTRLDQRQEDTAITLPEFCKEKKISRPTAYSWADRGLITLEKRGGRQFVIEDRSAKKYQREPSTV